MTFRNEVLEGIAAYKAMTPTGQDNYYNEKAQIAKRENDDYKEQQRLAKQYQDQAAANKAAGSPLIPTQSRSDTIGSGPGQAPQVAQAPPSSNVDPDMLTGTGGTMRRGGRVRRFADGGAAEPVGFAGGLAAGLKSTFRLPQQQRQQQQAINTNPPTNPVADAGIPGSNDAAVTAAVRYGAAPAPADPDQQYRRGGRISRGRAIHTGYQRGGPVEKNPYHTEMTDELYPGAGQGEGDEEMSDEDIARLKAGAGKGGTLWQPYEYEDEPGHPTNLPEQPRRVRSKAFDDGGLASAMRGGKPEYDPSQDPRVIERNHADDIIREIISAQAGDQNEANDPSIELRERGEADRRRTALPSPDPNDLPTPPQPSPAAVRSAARRRGQLPQAATQPPADQDPADSAALEQTFQSPAPSVTPSKTGYTYPLSNSPPSSQGMPEPSPDGANTDDAYLSTDNAQEPPGKISPSRGAPGEPDEPTMPSSQGPVNARPTETQIPPPDAKYPTAPPGEYSIPRSSTGEWIERNFPFLQGRNEPDAEAAADKRWQDDINRRKAAAKVGPLEQVTPEQRAQRDADLAQVLEDEKAGLPSERLRARRRAIETGHSPMEFVDKEAPPIGPIRAGVESALGVKPAGPIAPADANAVYRDKNAAPAAAAPTAEPAPGTGPGTAQRVADRKALEKRAADWVIRQLGGTPAGDTATAPAAGAPAGGPQYGPPAPAPAEAPATPAAPAGPAVAMSTRPPGAGDPSAYGPVTQRAAGDPDYVGIQPETPTKYPTTVAQAQGKTNGTNTPGGSPGARPAPPPGSAPANAPSTAEKPETRVVAYDPTVDQVDPQTGRTLPRQLDTQGRAIATGPPTQLVPQGDGGPPGSPTNFTGYTNQQLAMTLNGASTLVRPGVNGGPPPVGHLAASRPVFNQFVQAHNQGGRLTPGEAIVAGMTGRYMAMLSQGRVQQANMMAYGILQAANLEAAAHGASGRDKLARGDTLGAKQDAVAGLNYMADGVTQSLSADGNYIISRDPRTQQVTGQTPFDGRVLMATLFGLDNGNLFWKTLEASAQMLQKPDRNAEGRQLSNDLRRRQIALADQRLANPRMPRGSGGPTTSGGMTAFQQGLAQIRGVQPPPPSRGGGGGGGGSGDNNDGLIYYDVQDPTEPAEAPETGSRRSPSDLDEEDLYA